MDRSASKVIAMLAVICMESIIIPAYQKVSATMDEKGVRLRDTGWIWIAVLLFQVFFLSFVRSISDEINLVPLENSARTAMRWVKQNTQPDSTFLVLDNSSSWETDKTAEWFPALTDRVSLMTIQGKEWLSPENYWNLDLVYTDMKECVLKDINCLENWASQNAIQYDFIFIVDDPCKPNDTYCISILAADLRLNTQYKNLYRQDNVEVYLVE